VPDKEEISVYERTDLEGYFRVVQLISCRELELRVMLWDMPQH
jgi:hypothetical protein